MRTHASVTQPVEADVTILMYLYRVPEVALRGGATQAARREAHSASLTLVASITRLLASMVIWSPSWKRKRNKQM